MNKIIKKITSIAVASLTTVSFSLTAFAAAPCISHTSVRKLASSKIVSMQNHRYLYEIRLDENNVAHNIYRDCMITTREHVWQDQCTKCGTVTNTYTETISVHSVRHA